MPVEPGFKSRDDVAIDATAPLPIGAVAELLGVATSTLRYYDRRGLAPPDARVSGQRRYGPSTIRRLVFIQMLQDSGLSLAEIEGILHAPDNASWKDIANRRLVQLDEDLARLQRSRDLLEAALMCRFDHPLDECRVMNAEIDHRLSDGEPAA
ncbi:MAG: MerR family transcriptional regulator [Acidimicrobiales bacterium]|nr:MerR family transcriptional regulator [Acidimicrobiales bacterium]